MKQSIYTTLSPHEYALTLSHFLPFLAQLKLPAKLETAMTFSSFSPLIPAFSHQVWLVLPLSLSDQQNFAECTSGPGFKVGARGENQRHESKRDLGTSFQRPSLQPPEGPNMRPFCSCSSAALPGGPLQDCAWPCPSPVQKLLVPSSYP